MPNQSIDPETLTGEGLAQWYRRSPAELEKQRQAQAAKRYQDFFYGPGSTSHATAQASGTSARPPETPTASAAQSAARTALPKFEQGALRFVEREPYLRVGDNWATRAGRRAHAALEERVDLKPNWKYEPDVLRKAGRPLKPDVGTPQRDPTDLSKRYYLELKPNTPSGRAAAAKAVMKYSEATGGKKVRPIYYDPGDFM